MSHESLVYAINLAIAAILAAILTEYWRRAGRGTGLGVWTSAAWIMAVADLVFAVRPQLPLWMGRFVPTLLVTIGLGVLLMGARQTAGLRARWSILGAVSAAHAALLIFFLVTGGQSAWRTASNGVIWTSLSLASFVVLRQLPAASRQALAIPAVVFLGHGLFHAGRTLLAAVEALRPSDAIQDVLQMAGDGEVSVFMVALFVSLLAAHLALRNAELRQALDEVQLLSGLLPLCAWCHKVRDTEGYWQQVERYFSARSGVTFTHSICDTCLEQHFPDEAPSVSATSAQRS
ncbi:MAG: hypothetical protein U0P30_13600 [Vicinamibacterales bacterium]